MPRTLLLPAVSCWPPKFGLPYFASAGVHSVLIFDQSMSSSSATSIGIDVITPWPISSCVSMMRTVSSLLTLSQMLGSNEPAASSSPRFAVEDVGEDAADHQSTADGRCRLQEGASIEIA